MVGRRATVRFVAAAMLVMVAISACEPGDEGTSNWMFGSQWFGGRYTLDGLRWNARSMTAYQPIAGTLTADLHLGHLMLRSSFANSSGGFYDKNFGNCIKLPCPDTAGSLLFSDATIGPFFAARTLPFHMMLSDFDVDDGPTADEDTAGLDICSEQIPAWACGLLFLAVMYEDFKCSKCLEAHLSIANAHNAEISRNYAGALGRTAATSHSSSTFAARGSARLLGRAVAQRDDLTARLAALARTRTIHIPAETGARAHSVSSATDLAIPWTQWPSTSILQSGGAASVSVLDSASNYMGFAHTATYASLGAQGGEQQRALLPIGSSNGAAEIWLGTYYDTPAHAQAVVADVTKTLTSLGIAATPCGTTLPNCFLAGVTGFGISAVYVIFVRDNVAGEIALAADRPTFQANTSSLSSTFGGLARAAIGSVEAAVAGHPVPVGVLPELVKIDWLSTFIHQSTGDRVSVRFAAKSTPWFVVAYHYVNAGTDLPSATLTLLKKGKQIARYSMKPATTPSHIAYFAYQFHGFPKSTRGALKARFSITMAGTSDTRTVPITITGR